MAAPDPAREPAADPPRHLAAGASAEEGRVALLAALPSGARVKLGPLSLPFGAHAQGWLVAFRVEQPLPGEALWYLTPDEAEPGRWRLLRLREPQPADGDIDSTVTAAAALGPEGARDLIVLESLSRAAPAGAARADIGTVYRRRGGGAEPVPALAPLLDGARDIATATQRLQAPYATLLPTAPGAVAEAFVSLPLRWVPLTRLERLQRLQPGHPLHGVLDARNGYLATRGDAGEPAYVAALFRHAEGGVLLALQQRHASTQRTHWLRRESVAAAWRDVSAEVMPAWREDAPYLLPRVGRTVRLEGSRSGAWRWDGRRFVPASATR
jgi:hypothetical protein